MVDRGPVFAGTPGPGAAANGAAGGSRFDLADAMNRFPGGFEPLRRYKVAETETWAQPAISGNRIFVKDVSTLTLWTLG